VAVATAEAFDVKEKKMQQEIRHPVRLLQDDRGIYGIGGELIGECAPVALVLRRDRLANVEVDHQLGLLWRKDCHPMLQPITNGVWGEVLEERLRREFHGELLRRAGWVGNRRKYRWLKLNSLFFTNTVICQALAEAADQNALKMAHRFQFRYRYPIYRAAALSQRALQLAATFPVLAAALYSKGNADAACLVEAGAPLHHVAAAMGIPMAVRKIKAGAASGGLLAAEIAARHPDLFHTCLPDSLPRAKLWLYATWFANNLAGSDFMEWTAKHCLEISNDIEVMRATLTDLSDWVTASRPDIIIPGPISRRPWGRQFVTRPFSADMSLQTVTKLSAEWHEAVANNMDGPDHPFPAPWCAAGQSGGYEIIPIASSGELYREGRAMHHCAGIYEDKVQKGRCYLYSVREKGKRIATLELMRGSNQILIGQLRGPCNAQVPNAVVQAVRVWLRAQPFDPKHVGAPSLAWLHRDGGEQ
jgi:hypothetical protein